VEEYALTYPIPQGETVMSEKRIEICYDTREIMYSITETAKLARVTTEFIHKCEGENLVHATMAQGNKGYGHEAIRRLIRIRHLHQDLGLDLMAVDCILRMRKQIATLQKQLDEMEQRMYQREQELLQEIQSLQKRIAIKCDWEEI
jgi:DNA-binding transcriptional MerR regulator